jgi:hypothetical protein
MCSAESRMLIRTILASKRYKSVGCQCAWGKQVPRGGISQSSQENSTSAVHVSVHREAIQAMNDFLRPNVDNLA